MNKLFVYLALGLSVLAVIVSGVAINSKSFGANPTANCNGRPYCTSFPQILVQNSSTTGVGEVDGGLAVGGSALNQQISIVGAATSTINAFTLGPLTGATSSATSTINIPVAGLAVGDPCVAGLFTTSTMTQTAFGIDANITSSSAANATSVVTFWNGVNVAVTQPTSTLRVTCFHLAI